MIDPRPFLQAVQAAYALPDTAASVVDVIYGHDLNGEQPYGIVTRQPSGRFLVGIRGTRTIEEWIEDAKFFPADGSPDQIESGFWDIFQSFRTGSGSPLSAYAGADVGGHSLGAALAALWAVHRQAASYCLFAAPKVGNSAFVAKLADIPGAIYAEAGDVVPHLPLLGYAAFRGVTYLTPPGVGDLAYHHSLSTYAASIEASAA